MRKLWVKAWMTLDGVFDADTMDHWWPPADEEARDEARRLEYVTKAFLLSHCKGCCGSDRHNSSSRSRLNRSNSCASKHAYNPLSKAVVCRSMKSYSKQSSQSQGSL